VLVRAAIVALCLVSGVVVVARSSKSEAVPIRESLSSFPMTLGSWNGRRLQDFDARILGVLGVDEYLNSVYAAPGQPTVGLYIGYYQSQRQGDTMHSPLNCLPGAGWLPVKRERITIPVVMDKRGEQPAEINQIVIEKGLDRQIVLYWYQSHGRVVASEYWGKVHMVLDAVRLNRTDGAMIRVIAPIDGSDGAAEARARDAAVDFARVLFGQLDRFLPA
jgi:EpsI family protein